MSNEIALALINRLKEKSIIIPNGCWLWNEYLDKKGYGRTKYNGFTIRVHRLSAIIFLFLDINDKEQHALHKAECPNRHCWNPDHLYIGNNQDNVNDRIFLGHNKGGPGRPPQTHCKNGHELVEPNIYRNKSGSKTCKNCKLSRNKV